MSQFLQLCVSWWSYQEFLAVEDLPPWAFSFTQLIWFPENSCAAVGCKSHICSLLCSRRSRMVSLLKLRVWSPSQRKIQFVLFQSMQWDELPGMRFMGIPQILGKLVPYPKRKQYNRENGDHCSVRSCCGGWEQVSLELHLSTPK